MMYKIVTDVASKFNEQLLDQLKSGWTVQTVKFFTLGGFVQGWALLYRTPK